MLVLDPFPPLPPFCLATKTNQEVRTTSENNENLRLQQCQKNSQSWNKTTDTDPLAAHAWSFSSFTTLLCHAKVNIQVRISMKSQSWNKTTYTHPFAAHAWSFSSLTTLLCDAKRNIQVRIQNEKSELEQDHSWYPPPCCSCLSFFLPYHPSVSCKGNIQVRIQNEQSELEQDHWYSPPCCWCLILFLPYHPSVYKIGMKKRKIFVTTKVSHYSAFRWAWRQQETYPFGAYHLHWLGWLWLFHEHNWLWAKKGWGSSWCFGGCWRGITFACLPLWFGQFGWSLSRIKEFVSNRWFEEGRFLLANTACIGTHLSTFGRWWALLRKNVSPVE